MIVANSTFDAAATERARTEAANLVAPVNVSISNGEIIVRRGDRVDDFARERLERFGLLEARPDAGRAAGWFLLAVLTVVAPSGLDLAFPLADLAPQQRVAADSAAAYRSIGRAQGHRRSSVLPYVVPTAAVGLLLAVLLDGGAALMVTGILALLGGAIIGSVEFAAYILFGGVAGVIVIRRGEKLSYFVQAAVAVAVAQIAVVTLFTLLGDRDSTGLFELVGASWRPRSERLWRLSARSSSSETRSA